MATETEVEDVVSTARSAGCEDLILLHCISSYPAPVNQANISQVSELAKKFNVISGLSDHTLGTVVSVAAVACRRCVIEKHFICHGMKKVPIANSQLSLVSSKDYVMIQGTLDSQLVFKVLVQKRQKDQAKYLGDQFISFVIYQQGQL